MINLVSSEADQMAQAWAEPGRKSVKTPRNDRSPPRCATLKTVENKLWGVTMMISKFVYSACRARFARLGALKGTISSVSLAIFGIALLAIWVPVAGGLALAQSGTDSYDPLSRPIIGATGGMQDLDTPQRFEWSGGNGILRHRDFAGNPCLAVGGSARPHVIDPNLYDDVVTVVNNCPQRIAMQVCYYQSEDCIQMDIPGESHQEAILGILPATKDFRFEFREKF